MDLEIQPGVYVIAVSGGVDSMVLLDMLRQRPDLRLIVAHFDHGIRPDSAEDRLLVQQAAAKYGLQFEYEEGGLGPGASEDVARQARYDFLHKVRQAHNAIAIITAHHQDDVLETAVHNILRGSGRLGVSALRNRDTILRPLLQVNKDDIRRYAAGHDLLWREDSTNAEMRYRRNYIRHALLPAVTAQQKKALLQQIRIMKALNVEIDELLTTILRTQITNGAIRRHWFIMLPHNVSREVLAAWLRMQGVTELSSDMLERLVVAAKTYRSGKQAAVNKNCTLLVGAQELAIRCLER